MAELQAVDYDPFVPQLAAVDHDPFAGAAQPFATRSTARAPSGHDFDEAGYDAQRDIRSTPSDAKYARLPASQNIEDRRGDRATVDSVLRYVTGLDREKWRKMMAHPLTPFSDLFAEHGPLGEPSSPLAEQAGINNVGADQSYALPFQP